jgi:CheY-like chemotaxis protein
MDTPTKPITVLVAEDDPDDRVLAEDLLRRIEWIGAVNFVSDGEELIDYLLQCGCNERLTARTPDLILLDLNMPRKNGLQALAEIKAIPALAQIPVVLLTGSDRVSDVNRAYELGARSYMVKPLTMQRVKLGLGPSQARC